MKPRLPPADPMVETIAIACLVAAQPALAEAPAKPVLTRPGGAETLLSPDEAARAGLTRVSLRDDWTPYIFQEPLAPDGGRLLNRYRSIYLGLAQNRSD